MMWGSNKKLDAKRVLISLNESEARLFLLENHAGKSEVLSSTAASYSSSQELEAICKDWLQPLKAKGTACQWLLSRSLYKTFSIAAPKVPDSELASTIKWLVKDQLEQSLDSVLVSYYRPHTIEREADKIVAVAVEKEFVENLINITTNLQLDLSSIQIDELSSVAALGHLSEETQICGLIDEDHQGLIYNFYVCRSLAFTRHIRGRFFPNQSDSSFSLDDDNNEEQTDRFLLETQRTLDYCISQFFRSPVNRLALNASKADNNNLVESLEQIAELPVDLVEVTAPTDDSNSETLALTISEAGAAIGKTGQTQQWIDFYLPQYRPKPLEFGFKYAVGICLVAFAGFVGYGVLQTSELNQLENQLGQSEQKLKETQASLDQLSKQLGVKDSLQNLDSTINQRQAELVASRKLLNKVEKTAPSKPVLYSEVLSALSKQTAKSLWLTQIKLTPSTIGLAGETTIPESIPNYINEMSKNTILASQFEDLKIQRSTDNTKLVQFEMTNGRYNNAN